ncbi:MAG: CDP-alcohol phosphatidyltransferase family protein [Candidatus Saccharimonas sp.]
MVERLKLTGQFPNFLSVLRLLVSWVPLWLLLTGPAEGDGNRWLALTAFVLIALTDKLDGILARAWDQITKFGKIMDPLADKALVLLSLIGLCLTGLAEPFGWIVFGVIIARELAVTLLRFQKSRSNLIVPANRDGKIKMALQSIGITIAFMPFDWAQWTALGVLTLSLYHGIKSGWAYVKA